MSKNYTPKPSCISNQAIARYPKILHSILLEGHNFLYQGLIPNWVNLPPKVYQLSKCSSLNLTEITTPDAAVQSKDSGYEFNFSAGLVFSALETAFFISAFLHPQEGLDYPRMAKELKSRLINCSDWRNVKGSRFAYLDDPPLHACLQKASPFCPREEKDLREVFALLFPTILFSVALHERTHVMWGHLRLEKESRLCDDGARYMRVCRALELHADIVGTATLIAYLSQMGDSKEKIKIAGYCVLGAFVIMHYAQQEHDRRGYHPPVNVRYISARNVLAATDGVFHMLTASVTLPLIEGLTELAMFYDDHHVFGPAFDLFHSAFEDWVHFSATMPHYLNSSAPVIENNESLDWKHFFYSLGGTDTKDYREIKDESRSLLELLVELIEGKLRPYSEQVFNPDTWKQNASVSWIGG